MHCFAAFRVFLAPSIQSGSGENGIPNVARRRKILHTMSIQHYEEKCKYSNVNNSRKIYIQTLESYDKPYFASLHI